MKDYMLPCFFKKYIGLDCIGCGMQRSLKLLFEGEFVKAFEMFPALYSTLFLFLFIGLHLIDKNRKYHNFVILFAILNASIMIVSYIYKMKFIF